jgi:uncharacterized delta-60 repeat protein
MTRSRSVSLRVQTLEGRETPSTGGLLDPTFGSGGIAPPVSTTDVVNDGVVEPGGKIVTVGFPTAASHDFVIARYNPDGSADATFGSQGRVTTHIVGTTSNDIAWAVAVQPGIGGELGIGGKLVAVGYTSYSKGGKTVEDWALARYNPNGTLDTTFGTGGVVVTDLGTNNEAGRSIAIQPDGRIIVAGYYNNGYSKLALVRYTANGALDPTFGTRGKVLTSIRVGDFSGVRGENVAVQPDGKIVVGGSTNDNVTSYFLLARYNADGSPDTSFGGGTGIVTTAFPNGRQAGAGSVAIQPDGRIVLTGVSNSAGGVDLCISAARYNPDGSLDPTFGSGGLDVVRLNLPDPSLTQAVGYSGAIEADGRIVIGGQVYSGTGSTHDAFATRLNPDGTVDLGYGTAGDGAVLVSWPSTLANIARSVQIERDGRAVFVTNNYGPFRLLSSAPQIGSFTANPNPAPAGSTVTLSATGLTDGNPGATVTQVAFYADTNGDGVLDAGDTLIGYGTNASGTWTLNWSTIGYAAGTYTLFAQASDNLGAVGDPDLLNLQLT